MKVYIYILICVLSVIPTSVNAQLFGFNIKSNNQLFIEQAVNGSIYKITQYYQLCDTVKSETFGREGKDYFNKVIYISINTENGLLFENEALTPWINDPDFEEYRNSYKPILFRSDVSNVFPRPISMSEFSLSISNTLMQHEDYCVFRDSLLEIGLKCDTVVGRKDGWIVWIVSESNLENSDSLQIISFHKEINIQEDFNSIGLETPETKKNVIGGLYITPLNTQVGQITFYLSGILRKNGTEWSIVYPFIKQKSSDKGKLTVIKSGINSLDPIKKRKK